MGSLLFVWPDALCCSCIWLPARLVLNLKGPPSWLTDSAVYIPRCVHCHHVKPRGGNRRTEDHNNHTFRLDYTHTYFCITMWLNIISMKHNSQLDTHALQRMHLEQTLEVKSTWGMSCRYGKPSAVSVRPAHILHRANRRAASGMSGARVLSRTAPITSAVG